MLGIGRDWGIDSNSPLTVMHNILHLDSAGEANPGKFILRQGKSRRRIGGDELVVQINDNNGAVALEANPPINPPF